jgi:hypothetical protein
MVSGIKPFALLLLSAGSALAQLDLNPTLATRELEGVRFAQLVFKHGKDRVTYEQPSGWSYRGSTTILALTPPQKTQAEATIQAMPLSRPPAPLTAERMAELRQRAISIVPKGAENIEVVKEEQSPIKIDDRETFEVVLGYVLYGQRFQSSVLFLTLDDAEMVFRLRCSSSDFTELATLFRGSLASLQWQRPPR